MCFIFWFRWVVCAEVFIYEHVYWIGGSWEAIDICMHDIAIYGRRMNVLLENTFQTKTIVHLIPYTLYRWTRSKTIVG